MLRATQSFGGIEPAYDARIGASGEEVDFSVISLQQLGRCPLNYFFRFVLGVRELDDPAGILHISRSELGSRVHDVLERIYRRLLAEDRFAEPDEERLHAEAIALLDDEPGGVLGPVGLRLGRRLPLLGRLLEERWASAVSSFLRNDLRRMVDSGELLRELEQPRSARIVLDSGEALAVHGRFDRRSEKGDRSIVADYKTSGKLDDRCNATGMLKGREIQVPVYRLLAGAGRVDLLGVSPSYSSDDSVRSFAGFADDRAERGFHETLEVLLELSRQGRYPLHDSPDCKRCAYSEACRRNHPPTLERENHAEDTRRFRSLQRKNASKFPLLSDLEAKDRSS